MTRIIRVLTTLAIIIAPAWAGAQETINSATVSGRVSDPQGAVVPGARVIARQVDTNVVAETITNQEGRYRFPLLRVGVYEIGCAQLCGFGHSLMRGTVVVQTPDEFAAYLAGGAPVKKDESQNW